MAELAVLYQSLDKVMLVVMELNLRLNMERVVAVEQVPQVQPEVQLRVAMAVLV